MGVVILCVSHHARRRKDAGDNQFEYPRQATGDLKAALAHNSGLREKLVAFPSSPTMIVLKAGSRQFVMLVGSLASSSSSLKATLRAAGPSLQLRVEELQARTAQRWTQLC